MQKQKEDHLLAHYSLTVMVRPQSNPPSTNGREPLTSHSPSPHYFSRTSSHPRFSLWEKYRKISRTAFAVCVNARGHPFVSRSSLPPSLPALFCPGLAAAWWGSLDARPPCGKFIKGHANFESVPIVSTFSEQVSCLVCFAPLGSAQN